MRDIMHRAQPGPMYWDWRCLKCGEPVDRHAPWYERHPRLRTVLACTFGGFGFLAVVHLVTLLWRGLVP